MSEFQNTTGEYKFNLLPPKTREELEIVKERDNSVFYAFLLVLVSVIVFLIVSLGDIFLVSTRVKSSEESLAFLNEQIKSFDSMKEQNGELFLKAQTLEPVLAKDIKLSEILEIASQMILNVESASITAYNREYTGEFSVTLAIDNYVTVNQILENSKSIDRIEDVFLKKMSLHQISSGQSIVEANISFKVNILKNG